MTTLLATPRSLALAALALGLWVVGCEDGEPAAFRGVHPDGCLDGTEGMHHAECDGLQFDLSVPPECLTRACGVIVDVHGATMTGEQQEANTSLGELAHGRGYLVLQPWAPEAWWDVPQYALDAQVLALTARVMDVFSADARRVHITGFSQGGYMTWRMLCRQPELFASYAPLAASGENVLREESFEPPCVGAGSARLAPRPIFYAHGTADSVVSFSGATETLETLRTAWGLTEQESIHAGDGYAVTRYSGAGAGLIELMQHDLRGDYTDEGFGAWQGHCFPGSDAAMGCGAGPSWGEAVLAFFEAHPKD